VLYATVFFSTPSLITRYLISAVVLYLAAKLTENKDDIIFETLGYSGHSIKHILAALTVFCLILMMKKRNINVAD
jgi:hypothetical protein